MFCKKKKKKKKKMLTCAVGILMGKEGARWGSRAKLWENTVPIKALRESGSCYRDSNKKPPTTTAAGLRCAGE